MISGQGGVAQGGEGNGLAKNNVGNTTVAVRHCTGESSGAIQHREHDACSFVHGWELGDAGSTKRVECVGLGA
jgi:hypothetical protein